MQKTTRTLHMSQAAVHKRPTTLCVLCGLIVAVLSLCACQSSAFRAEGQASGYADGDTLLLVKDVKSLVPVGSTVVERGRFILTEQVDTPMLCMLYSSRLPDCAVTFFMEPGETVCIEMKTQPGKSRVSGSTVNNEWQRLCDLTANSTKRMLKATRQMQAAESSPANILRTTTAISQELHDDIMATAERNKDNALGRFLSRHYSDAAK